MAKHAEEHFLDVDFEVARSVHRVVRAMHDGECPNCQNFIESYHMRREHPTNESARYYAETIRCPRCGFTITGEEAQAAIAEFAPVMQKNLEVFEQWRAKRRVQP